MTRKGKNKIEQKVEEFSVEQEVIRTNVEAQSFDLLFRFTKDQKQVEVFMDELMHLLLEGLTDRYGQIVVKINWWSKDLSVIAPHIIPDSSIDQNALQGHQETPGSTEDSNPSPTMETEK